MVDYTNADRVDHHNETGRIIVPVGQGTATTFQYVVVDGDSDALPGNSGHADPEGRVDALRNVEEIVATAGQSIMDFTAVGAARQITLVSRSTTSISQRSTRPSTHQ